MHTNEEGRNVYDISNGSKGLNSLTPYGEQRQLEQELTRRLKQMECELLAYATTKECDMKDKFALIAQLFQMDVMSEDDALKACKTVIQQHAKARPVNTNTAINK